jgi:hypothetical protein
VHGFAGGGAGATGATVVHGAGGPTVAAGATGPAVVHGEPAPQPAAARLMASNKTNVLMPAMMATTKESSV